MGGGSARTGSPGVSAGDPPTPATAGARASCAAEPPPQAPGRKRCRWGLGVMSPPDAVGGPSPSQNLEEAPSSQRAGVFEGPSFLPLSGGWGHGDSTPRFPAPALGTHPPAPPRDGSPRTWPRQTRTRRGAGSPPTRCARGDASSPCWRPGVQPRARPSGGSPELGPL